MQSIVTKRSGKVTEETEKLLGIWSEDTVASVMCASELNADPGEGLELISWLAIGGWWKFCWKQVCCKTHILRLVHNVKARWQVWMKCSQGVPKNPQWNWGKLLFASANIQCGWNGAFIRKKKSARQNLYQQRGGDDDTKLQKTDYVAKWATLLVI